MRQTVVIVWSDGTEERVDSEDAYVRDGELVIVVRRDEERHIPLTSIREWRKSR